MKYLVGVMVFLSSFIFASEHKILITTTEAINPGSTFCSLEVVEWKILGMNAYELTVESSLAYEDVVDQVEQHMAVLAGEAQQCGLLSTKEAASTLDSRIIFIIDNIEDEATYHISEAELDSRIIFIIDGSGATYPQLYRQYHVSEVDAHLAWEHSNGEHATVAVIDTGVDLDHPFLANNIVPGYDFVDSDHLADDERPGIDSNGNGALDEGWGHGTHVAGIIKTIAPGAKIMPIRAIDSDGNAELSDIVAGVHYAIDNGASVINLSLSIPNPSVALDEAIARAKKNNVLVVTSAGNTNSDEILFPARESGVLTVAGLDELRQKANFSNFGQEVDISAPAVGIVSTHPGGTYVVRSGTSMAAPIVSAQIALIQSALPYKSENWVRHKVRTTAECINLENPEYSNDLGNGIADTDELINQ